MAESDSDLLNAVYREISEKLRVDTAMEIYQMFKGQRERLGHIDIATTMNIYSHVLPSSVREAAEKIDSLVFASA